MKDNIREYQGLIDKSIEQFKVMPLAGIFSMLLAIANLLIEINVSLKWIASNQSPRSMKGWVDKP